MAPDATIDHTSFRVRGEDGKIISEAKKKAGKDLQDRWWQASKEDAPAAVWALLRVLEREQDPRRRANELYAHLYGEKDWRSGYLNRDLSRRQSAINSLVQAARPTVTYNIIRMAVDTLAAKISKAKPKANFTTTGGNWSQQRRAKRLDRFVYGAMFSGGYYQAARSAFRDGGVYDIGFIKVDLDEERRRFVFERVFPDELWVGESDGRYGKPRTMLQKRWVPRDMLLTLVEKMDPKADAETVARRKQAIREAKSPEWTEDRIAALGDMVEFCMTWHLPSHKGATDGRYWAGVEGAELVDTTYVRARFPFLAFRFSERLQGYYGQGVAEQLASRQRTINMKLRTINDALRLMSVPRYFVKNGSHFSVKHLTNEVGIIMQGMAPPQVITGNVVPPELFASVDKDIQQGLEEVGVSLLSAAARKPAGLDSAPSLREYNDIETERFILVGQAYEEMAIDAARVVIDIAREEAEAGNKLEVHAPVKRGGKNGYDQISWKDVAMDEESYILQATGASSLPTTPAARRKTLGEWYEAGLIDGTEYRRLMDMPDLDETNSLAFAARDDVDATIERFLDGDEDPTDEEDVYQPPEPYQDLQWGLRRMQSAYLRARMEGCPEGRLELLRRWMAQAEGLLKPPEVPPAPTSMGPIDTTEAGLVGPTSVPTGPGNVALPDDLAAAQGLIPPIA